VNPHIHQGRSVVQRLGALGLAVALAAPVGAQQMMPVSSPAQEGALKTNVRTFEIALQTAVVRAGAQLAQWAGQFVPNVPMVFAQDPSVRSVPLLDNSLVFHVEVSEIVPTSVSLWTQYLQQLQQQARARGGGASRVGATGVPPGMTPPDPIAPGKSGDLVTDPLAMGPDQYYTKVVRDALIDTMLDSSGVLPLREGQTLTVACIPVDVAVTNPLNRNPSKELVLTIKGEDLLAYRQGALSREAAKQRIIERRF